MEKLVNYGMGFIYENNGSKGEKITSFELGIEISNQDGKIYYSISSSIKTLKESNDNYIYLCNKVEKECISQTSSF